MKYFLYIFTFLILTSSTINLNRILTGFSRDILKIAKEFEVEEHGKNLCSIERKEFLNLIKKITKYDIINGDLVFKSNDTLFKEKIKWKDKLNGSEITKTVYEAKKYFGQNKKLVIVEYLISRKTKPFYIRLRTLNNSFEELIIDKKRYGTNCYEFRLIGGYEVIIELDSLQKKTAYNNGFKKWRGSGFI